MKSELKSLISSTVKKCRALLFQETIEQLEGIYGLHADGHFEAVENLPGLIQNEKQKQIRKQLESWIDEEVHGGLKRTEAYTKLLRETAFTHLNRLSALKMMETRKLIKGTLDKGSESNGFKFYLADHDDELKNFESGQVDETYQNFILWQYRQIAEKDHLEVLFNPDNLPSLLFPRPRILKQLLDFLNNPKLNDVWQQEETVGWIYQYFIEEDKDRVFEKIYKQKQKMGLREIPQATQIFTPRWIVQYLVENTLGRLWLRMHPDSNLASKMKYYVPNPYNDKELIPAKPVSEITLLDPACGTMHFGLVAFDLFYEMYLEELGGSLATENTENAEEEKRKKIKEKSEIPTAIVENNIYGIDIDLRAIQLSALTLYLKAKSYNKDVQIKKLNLTYTDILVLSETEQKEFVEALPVKHPIAKELLIQIIPDLNKAYYLGSLLKIEDTVQDFISRKQREIEKYPLFEQTEKGSRQDYWQQVRDDILQGLNAYVSEHTNGHSFIAGESIQVLSLIDALLKKHDIVVANPPFSGRKNWGKEYADDLKKLYPENASDMYTAFIERNICLLNKDGFLGMINLHTFMFTSSYEGLRRIILEKTTIQSMNHVGPIFMELSNPFAQQATTFILQNTKPKNDSKAIYFRMVNYIHQEKINRFEKTLTIWRTNLEKNNDKHLFVVRQVDFKVIPGWPFIYWISTGIRNVFFHNKLITQVAKTSQGLKSTDTFRFLRLWWEIDKKNIYFNLKSNQDLMKNNMQWIPHMKGGGYNKWYGNQECVVNWKNDAQEMKSLIETNYGSWSRNITNVGYFFKEGATYSSLTISNLSVRYLPVGFIFDVAGSTIHTSNNNHLFIIACLNSKLCSFLIKIINPTVNYSSGDIGRLPYPDTTKYPHLAMQVESATQICIHLKQTYSKLDSRTWEFIHPGYWDKYFGLSLFQEKQLAIWESEISKAIYKLYEIGDEDILQIESEFGALPVRLKKINSDKEDEFKETIRALKKYYLEKHIPEEAMKSATENDGEETTKSRRQTRYLNFEEVCLASGYHPDTVFEIITEAGWERPEERFNLALNWLEYAIGILMGRFKPGQKGELGCGIIHKNDFITGSLTITDEEFEEITQFFPVAFTDEQGKHAFTKEVEKQLCTLADPDGIMVLDEGHSDDLPAQIEDVLTIMLGNQQAEEVLATLIGQDYPDRFKFRKFMERDFFNKHHLKMYKKRPIYWLLQTINKNYSFYIFHERFDVDTLHKLLRNYIDPKLKMVEDQLREISNRLKNSEGPEYRQLSRDREKLDDLLIEIKEFAEKVRQVTQLQDANGKVVGYDPDINDGVILNLAPLHELIPWKEPTKYLDELQEGKYDWAHLAMRYWPERVLEKCKDDKSLAIAHGVEE